MVFMQTPEQPQEERITKKLAAQEVTVWVKQCRLLSFAVILCGFFTAIFSILHAYAGVAAITIFSIYGAYMFKKTKDKLDYYEKQYGVK